MSLNVALESLEVVPNVDDGLFLSISFLVTDAWRIWQLSLLSETAVIAVSIYVTRSTKQAPRRVLDFTLRQ
jgi:hypothetical protein